MSVEPLTTPLAIINKTPVEGVNYGQAAITALFAVCSGFVLYIIKTIIDEHYLRQYRDYKKLKADISYTLTMYANVYMNLLPHCDLTDEASTALRTCASKLGAFIEEWSKMHMGVPRKEILAEVEKELIGLSNRVCSTNTHDIYDDIDINDKACETIKKLLKMERL